MSPLPVYSAAEAHVPTHCSDCAHTKPQHNDRLAVRMPRNKILFFVFITAKIEKVFHKYK